MLKVWNKFVKPKDKNLLKNHRIASTTKLITLTLTGEWTNMVIFLYLKCGRTYIWPAITTVIGKWHTVGKYVQDHVVVTKVDGGPRNKFRFLWQGMMKFQWVAIVCRVLKEWTRKQMPYVMCTNKWTNLMTGYIVTNGEWLEVKEL